MTSPDSINASDQRRDLRYDCEQTAELLGPDGVPHVVGLLNISGGGAQVHLTLDVLLALGLPRPPANVPTFMLPFRIWLPGDEDGAPLEGDARVAYLVEADAGVFRAGLEFKDVMEQHAARLSGFIETCLRYSE